MPRCSADDDSYSFELFKKDIKILNRCFEEIDRFVAQIQSAAIAQKELEQQRQHPSIIQSFRLYWGSDPWTDLTMRAQLPLEDEYVDVLRKFKLSFNLNAKARKWVNDPRYPQVLRFNSLIIILGSCRLGLRKNIAPQIVAPLLSLGACELLQSCLSSKESDIWKSLGEAWRTPPEDWPDALPPPYRPVFSDGFAPYGYPAQMYHGRQGTEGHEARSSNGD